MMKQKAIKAANGCYACCENDAARATCLAEHASPTRSAGAHDEVKAGFRLYNRAQMIHLQGTATDGHSER